MIRLEDGMPYTTATLIYQGQQLTLHKVLIDTGSEGTAFAKNSVRSIGLIPRGEDPSYWVRGVGGEEQVFMKYVDALIVGVLRVENFEVELGDLEYGFEVDGIIGMDFLLQTRAVLDFANLTLEVAP